MADETKKQSKAARWVRRLFKWMFWSVVAYLVVVLTGLVPVNFFW